MAESKYYTVQLNFETVANYIVSNVVLMYSVCLA